MDIHTDERDSMAYRFQVQCFNCKAIRDMETNDEKLIMGLTKKSHFFDPCPDCNCGFARYIDADL